MGNGVIAVPGFQGDFNVKARNMTETGGDFQGGAMSQFKVVGIIPNAPSHAANTFQGQHHKAVKIAEQEVFLTQGNKGISRSDVPGSPKKPVQFGKLRIVAFPVPSHPGLIGNRGNHKSQQKCRGIHHCNRLDGTQCQKNRPVHVMRHVVGETHKTIITGCQQS